MNMKFVWWFWGIFFRILHSFGGVGNDSGLEREFLQTTLDSGLGPEIDSSNVPGVEELSSI